MRPTRRGYGVGVLLCVGVVMGVAFGPRSLPALLAPAVAAIGVGAIAVAAGRTPSVRRWPVRWGAVGDTRTVQFALEGDGTSTVTFTDDLEDGLAPAGPIEGRDEAADTYAYPISLERRGVHTVGPITLRTTDVFGLVIRDHQTTQTVEATVAPRPRELPESARRRLKGVAMASQSAGSIEFERIREFHPGDRLQDVAWKALGKRPDDLLVTDRGGDGEGDAVTVAVSSTPDALESALEVAAGVLDALPASVPVRLAVPGGTVAPATEQGGSGERARTLATATAGDAGRVGDVHVQGDSEGVTVAIDGATITVEGAT